MDLPSIGKLSTIIVYGYAIVVALAVAGLVAGCALRRVVTARKGATAGPRRRLSRIVVEYIGNTNWPEGPWPGNGDRRRNRASRVLMDHVRGMAVAREASPQEVERLVEDLRQAIRSAELVD